MCGVTPGVFGARASRSRNAVCYGRLPNSMSTRPKFLSRLCPRNGTHPQQFPSRLCPRISTGSCNNLCPCRPCARTQAQHHAIQKHTDLGVNIPCCRVAVAPASHADAAAQQLIAPAAVLVAGTAGALPAEGRKRRNLSAVTLADSQSLLSLCPLLVSPLLTLLKRAQV